jgi:hypothetical protein
MRPKLTDEGGEENLKGTRQAMTELPMGQPRVTCRTYILPYVCPARAALAYYLVRMLNGLRGFIRPSRYGQESPHRNPCFLPLCPHLYLPFALSPIAEQAIIS